MVVRQAQAYLSYVPGDKSSHQIAKYIKTQLIDEYGVTGVMLDPEDGKLTFVDFDARIKVKQYTDMIAFCFFWESFAARLERGICTGLHTLRCLFDRFLLSQPGRATRKSLLGDEGRSFYHPKPADSLCVP